MTAQCYSCLTQYPDDDIGQVCYACGGRGMIESYTPRREAEFSEEMQPTEYEVAALESTGFEDDSWHNDICVKFIRPCTFHGRPDGTVITIWVDAIKPEDREMCGDRFLVQAYNECEPLECEPLGEGFHTNDLNEALKTAREVLVAHEAYDHQPNVR